MPVMPAISLRVSAVRSRANDDPQAEVGAAERQRNAHGELRRWMAGDHRSNNTFRPE
jgi:hypothetical protein